MASSIKDHLHSKVTGADPKSDLFPIINSIPKDKLKAFLHQCIDESTPTSLNTMYFNSSSIDQLIPRDVMQHLLSFQALDLKAIKLVNKQE